MREVASCWSADLYRPSAALQAYNVQRISQLISWQIVEAHRHEQSLNCDVRVQVAVTSFLDPAKPHAVQLLGMHLVVWRDSNSVWR